MRFLNARAIQKFFKLPKLAIDGDIKMPIFVQWDWKEKTRSFLVIFHFLDDYSKPNLRFRKIHICKPSERFWLYGYKSAENLRQVSVMTWAPSHVETSLLIQLLSYANIINGLKEPQKRELFSRITVVQSQEGFDSILEELEEMARRSTKPSLEELSVELLSMSKEIMYGGLLLGLEESKEVVFCPILSTEYLEHIWNLAKPYLR